MKKKVLLMCFTFISVLSYGQQIAVSGRIENEMKGRVPFAKITFTNANDSLEWFGVITNDIGEFSINLPQEVYQVDVTVLGRKYHQIEIDLQTSEKELDIGVITIKTEVQLDEITINAEGLDYKLELDKKVYHVSKDLLANGSNLTDILQNIPSVQVEVDGAISIRGNKSISILIDGVPSGFANTASLLKTIPASSVERIEVITNPSAKYDSEGSGGIINVVLKKGKKKRTSRSIECYSGFRINSGLNINLNQGNENSSWYINAGAGYSEPKATYDLFIENETDTIKRSHQYTEKTFSQLYAISNIGGQISLDKNNAISADITYRYANANNPTVTIYEDLDILDNTSVSERLDLEQIKDHFFQTNLGYKLKLRDSIELNLKSNTQFSDELDISDIYEEETEPFQSVRSEDNIRKKNKVFKQFFSLDYTHVLKHNFQLELGLSNRYTNSDINFSAERRKEGVWNIIPEFNNDFKYIENITSFYGQFGKSFEKFKFQIGLRSELTQLNMLSMDADFNQTRSYLDFFPSGFLSYDFNKKNQIRLSLSRRIGRPKNIQLLPVTYLQDNRYIYTGNGELIPSYSALIELSFKTRLSDKISITPALYYSRISDVIEYVLRQENNSIQGETQSFFISQAINLNQNNSVGLELFFSYKLTDWLSMFCELRANAFVQTGNYESQSLNSQGAILHGRYHFNFNLPKSFKIQLQNRFRNGNTQVQVSRKAIYRMDIGISKEFNEKTLLTLNVKDIFNTWVFRMERIGSDFTQKITSQVRVPQLNLSFIYKINQKKYQGNRGRQYDKL